MSPRRQLVVRVFRLLVRLYPHEFRERFGAEMTQAFRDQLNDPDRAGLTAIHRVGIVCRALASLVVHGLIERGSALTNARYGIHSELRATQNRSAIVLSDGPPGPYPAETRPRELTMDTFLADLRHAFRGLRRDLGFTSVTMLTLAMGIGAVTTAFAVVDAVEFRPLPFSRPEELVIVGEARRTASNACGTCRSSWSAVQTWQNETRTLSATAVLEQSGARWYERDRAERLLTADVSPSFFSVLGVPPMLGRTFSEVEAGSSASRVVVLGHDLWRSRFGGDPGIVGNELDMHATHGRGLYTVIGVMPREFRFLDNQAWIPLANPVRDVDARRYLFVGRLASGRSLTEAGTELRVLHSRVASQRPQSDGEWTSVALPVREWVLQSRTDAGRGRLLLLSVTAFVLLMATANVASLSLARARTRAFEASVRSALGATRGRLVRQFLTESLALAVIGGALALGVAVFGIAVAGNALGANQAGFAVQLDLRVMSFALLVTILAAAGAGAAPASYGARDPLFALLGQKGGWDNAGGGRVQSGLVAIEIACSLMLLTGGGFLVKELVRLRGEPGFDPRGLYLAQLARPDLRDPSAQRDYARFARSELARTPGISKVGLTGRPASTVPVRVQLSAPALDSESGPNVVVADSAFFDVTSIDPLRGRLFQSADRFGGLHVAIVNEAAAGRLWPGQEALGQRLFLGDNAPEQVEVVGVVGNARVFNAPLKREAPAIIYRPFDQSPTTYPLFVVYGSGGRGEVIRAVRGTVAQLTGAVAEPSAVVSIEELQAQQIAAERLHALSVGAFAVMGLFLAAVGVFGIISYAAALRQREFSIRMALGASPREVAITVVRSGFVAVSIGVLAGTGGSVLMARGLGAMLGAATASDPWMIGRAFLLLAVVLAAAVYLPAWRAARTDPALALRE